MIKKALGIVAVFFATGCAHSIHSYTLGDSFPASRETKTGRAIQAEAEQFVILSFAFNTDYADEAYRKLLQNCPHGEIVGISGRYSTSMSFLSYTNKMKLEGICLD